VADFAPTDRQKQFIATVKRVKFNGSKKHWCEEAGIHPSTLRYWEREGPFNEWFVAVKRQYLSRLQSDAFLEDIKQAQRNFTPLDQQVAFLGHVQKEKYEYEDIDEVLSLLNIGHDDYGKWLDDDKFVEWWDDHATRWFAFHKHRVHGAMLEAATSKKGTAADRKLFLQRFDNGYGEDRLVGQGTFEQLFLMGRELIHNEKPDTGTDRIIEATGRVVAESGGVYTEVLEGEPEGPDAGGDPVCPERSTEDSPPRSTEDAGEREAGTPEDSEE